MNPQVDPISYYIVCVHIYVCGSINYEHRKNLQFAILIKNHPTIVSHMYRHSIIP